MNKKVIDLTKEVMTVREWKALPDMTPITVVGFTPSTFMPGVSQISGYVMSIEQHGSTEDFQNCYCEDWDITIHNPEEHLCYTLRVRTREELMGFNEETQKEDWCMRHYSVKLQAVAEEDLPHFADSYEELYKMQEQDYFDCI